VNCMYMHYVYQDGGAAVVGRWSLESNSVKS
jgi:hypothetical protein